VPVRDRPLGRGDGERPADLELSDGERERDAGIAHQVLASIAAARGDWHAAAVHLDASRQLAATFGTRELALAARLATFAVAQARGAHAEVAAFIPTIDATRPPMLSTLSLYHPGAAAHVDTGELDLAGRLADQLAADAERRRLDVAAQVADLRGRIAARRGEPAAAEQHFADAVDAITADTPLLIAAGIHLARGRLRRAQGRRHDAIIALGEARTIYEGLGARPYLERVDAELIEAGLARPTRRRDRSPLDLTPREQDVVTLALREQGDRRRAVRQREGRRVPPAQRLRQARRGLTARAAGPVRRRRVTRHPARHDAGAGGRRAGWSWRSSRARRSFRPGGRAPACRPPRRRRRRPRRWRTRPRPTLRVVAMGARTGAVTTDGDPQLLSGLHRDRSGDHRAGGTHLRKRHS